MHRGRYVTGEPTVILESCDRRRDRDSFSFTGLMEEITVHALADVLPALRRVEAAVAKGAHAAGYISYEAAPGINPVLPAQNPSPLPLLWFGIFSTRTLLGSVEESADTLPPAATGEWSADFAPEEYARSVDRIRDYIASGDVYQVNLTLRNRFHFTGEPLALYRQLRNSQQAAFSAFMDMGRFKILSASPELFFRLRDGVITVRPMKGTAPRGRWWQEDEALRERLRSDPKELAENLMIVDLLRNDLGIVAETGSVEAVSLFDLETFPTLHQLTSTITARPAKGAGLVEILQALFPSGSITGAPKKRAMEIISALERSPRGVYTGCIGYVSPPGASGAGLPEAVFSVAIRTLVLDGETGEGELGVGSGITWDSRGDAEFAECLVKGLFARGNRPDFQLIETILFEEGSGYFLLERHLERLAHSAAYFAFPCRTDHLRQELLRHGATLSGRHKVRVVFFPSGNWTIDTEPLPPPSPDRIIATCAASRTDSRDPFLYHKTTLRDRYNEERAARPDCGEVIFVNERGEVAEGATTNVVAKIDGVLCTPPLQSGLLPGVFREELLRRGDIVERVITVPELERVEELFLINSVRKWRRAKLV
jgi:para-aminobenzoate synthetase / 4-amino-4-deoxychorismate lyase